MSIRGGGVSDRGGHLVVSISHGNGSLVDNGVDGLGVSDGGGVGHGGHRVGISHGGLFNLPVLSRSLFDDVVVDDGSNLLSISHGSGVSLRIVSISVVENLGISLGLSLSLSLVKSVVLRSIRISVVVDHRLVMGGISDRGGVGHGGGNVDPGVGNFRLGVDHGEPGVGNFRLGVDHGVVVVDIGSLVGIDMGN